MQTEEFEQIPWSQLLPPADEGRRRILYLVAGILVALVAGVVAARSFGGPEPTVVALGEPIPESTSAAPAVELELEAAGALPSVGEVAATPLSEADLMAVLPEEETRAAAVVAEWFVIDYFTVDGGAGSRERVAAAVPDLAVDVLPHERVDGLSYVEWARSVRVEPSAPRSYDVTVWYGSVASRGGGPIARLPVKTVGVTVRFADSGVPQVVGLPRREAAHVLTQAGVAGEAAPDAVVASAVAEASTFGDAPEAVGAYRTAGAWHVVVRVEDPISGISWPLAIVVAE